MNFNSRINSERVVIASTLLVGWAIWTAWRHLILPALIAGGGLLLVATGWQPKPAPALGASGAAMDAVVYCSAAMVLAERRASGDAMEARVICPRVEVVPWVEHPQLLEDTPENMFRLWDGRRLRSGTTTVEDLPPAVPQRIRARVDRLSRDA